MRSTLTLILLLLMFGLGFYVAWQLTRPGASYVEDASADVMLERIETVAKMVTVEGYYSEVYTHRDFRRLFNSPYWDRLMLEIPAFQKQAIIRVKGKVSVGYDLEQMRIDLDGATRTIRLSNLPEPSIIATEYELEYFDLSEGTFNQFTEQDHNRLNARAREIIRREAEGSDLFQRAEAQGNELIELIALLAREGGWTVVRSDRPALAD